MGFQRIEIPILCVGCLFDLYSNKQNSTQLIYETNILSHFHTYYRIIICTTTHLHKPSASPLSWKTFCRLSRKLRRLGRKFSREKIVLWNWNWIWEYHSVLLWKLFSFVWDSKTYLVYLQLNATKRAIQ